MSRHPASAVVSLSGGMDSVTLLHYVRKALGYGRIHAISFDYGQRHKRELDEARWQVMTLGNVGWSAVPMPVLEVAATLGHSSLVDRGTEVPKLDDVMGDPQPSTYVPFRNLVLLSCCLSMAEAFGANTVFYGAQRHDLYCLSTDSYVLRETGFSGPTQLTHLVPGDIITDMDGGPTEVVAIARETVDVYAHICAGGAAYKCSLGHEVPIVAYDRSPQDGKSWINHRVTYVPAEHVKPGMYTVMPTSIDADFAPAGRVLETLTELRLWWACEGAFNNSNAVIFGQSREANPENYERICTLIESLGYKPWRMAEQIGLSAKMASDFVDLGRHSHEKVLPREVFGLDRGASREALEVLIKADGYQRGSDAYFFTTSPLMAQQVIALALQAGVPAKPQTTQHDIIAIHIPAFETSRRRPRTFDRYQAVKITSVSYETGPLEVARLKTSTGTYLGGGVGFLGQHNGYWDTTPEFVAAVNRVIMLDRKNVIKVDAPFVELPKASVLSWGLANNVDYSHTWSCYKGEKEPCLECPTCRERSAAFWANGVRDPLVSEERWNALWAKKD